MRKGIEWEIRDTKLIARNACVCVCVCVCEEYSDMYMVAGIVTGIDSNIYECKDVGILLNKHAVYGSCDLTII